MNLSDYQKAALRTFKAELTQRNLLANGALGLCGEAGEVADLIKKHLYPSKPGDGARTLERLTDELGDVLWYLAVLAEGVGVSLDTIAQQNIEKLAARHGPEAQS